MQVIPKLFSYIGIPFVDGGRDIKGCDCWGLAMLIYKDIYGITLPDYKVACDDKSRIDATINENKCYWHNIPYSEAKAPSLVVMRFNSITLCNHTGVYIGNGEFIHTANKINAHIASVNSPAWSRRIEGFYVLKGDKDNE